MGLASGVQGLLKGLVLQGWMEMGSQADISLHNSALATISG